MNLFSLLVFFVLAQAHIALAQTHAGDWNQYPYQDPASAIRFPDDEGTHKIIKGLEWWYVVIHAVGEITGDRYSILVSHFNNQTRFFNVTNVTRKTHETGTDFGLLKSAKGHLELTHQTLNGIDFFKTQKNQNGNLIPFHYEMQTNYKNMKLEGKLYSSKRPMMVGLDGFGPVGSAGNTWYYSFTNMPFNGALTYQGVTEPIHGQAWFDHQWGSFFVSPIEVGKIFESYEWFCIQLDQGYELMVSNVYDRQNRLPRTSDYGDIQLFDPQGQSLIASESTFTRTRYWQDPISKKYLSMGWKIQVPAWDMDLTLTPEHEDQMVRFPLKGDFWEGSIQVKGNLRGQPVSGKSFGELVHYFKTPLIEVKSLPDTYSGTRPLLLKWIIKNPDEGNPLHYKIFLKASERDPVLIQTVASKTFSSSHQTELNLQAHLHGVNKFNLTVRACSVDEVICGELNSKEVLVK